MGQSASSFEGRWIFVDGENYEEYLQDLSVSPSMIAVYTSHPPYLLIETSGKNVTVRSWKEGTEPKEMNFTIGQPFLYSAHGFKEVKIPEIVDDTLVVRAVETEVEGSPKWSNMAAVEAGYLIQTYTSLKNSVTCRRRFRAASKEEWDAFVRQNE
ncbi:fatty acid-binding protein 12-like [Diadema setosum]|uniref:fatty acid-binding protein 12-like n=1 Tax=Diadema setosum TaxID=31175 RepID=UPI003B39FC1F